MVKPDDQLRHRLEALNRGPLPLTARRFGEPGQGAPRPTAVAAAGESAVRPLPGLLRCGDVVRTSQGEHLQIRLALAELWPGGERLVAARSEFLKEQLDAAQLAVEPTIAMRAEWAAFVAALPDRAIVLDLETCGLAGSALFLVGVLRQIDGAHCVEMHVARNYSEEPSVLASLWQILARHDVLVTFNGKTFDWPLVRERSIRHRLDPDATQAVPPHIDVLHHARRRWRKRLPNCRLQTLELAICRRRREGDVPGHRIPAIYADFVRTGCERDMDAVLYHNALDLVTLFDLALRLAG
jgi:uncharacterized protein YprB with RNaseH-like and TPR domain